MSSMGSRVRVGNLRHIFFIRILQASKFGPDKEEEEGEEEEGGCCG